MKNLATSALAVSFFVVSTAFAVSCASTANQNPAQSCGGDVKAEGCSGGCGKEKHECGGHDKAEKREGKSCGCGKD